MFIDQMTNPALYANPTDPNLFNRQVVVSNSSPAISGTLANLTVAGLEHGIGDKVCVAVGRQHYHQRAGFSLTFVYNRGECPVSVGDVVAPARAAAAAVEQAVERSAATAAVNAAKREYRLANERADEPRDRLKELREEQAELTESGGYRKGLTAELVDAEAAVDSASSFASRFATKVRAAEQAVAELRVKLWRQVADSKLPDLEARRAAVLAKAEKFAREVAAELLTIEDIEKHLKVDAPPA